MNTTLNYPDGLTLERLREKARKHKREVGIKHGEALEAVAREAGFPTWHAATLALAEDAKRTSAEVSHVTGIATDVTRAYRYEHRDDKDLVGQLFALGISRKTLSHAMQIPEEVVEKWTLGLVAPATPAIPKQLYFCSGYEWPDRYAASKREATEAHFGKGADSWTMSYYSYYRESGYRKMDDLWSIHEFKTPAIDFLASTVESKCPVCGVVLKAHKVYDGGERLGQAGHVGETTQNAFAVTWPEHRFVETKTEAVWGVDEAVCLQCWPTYEPRIDGLLEQRRGRLVKFIDQNDPVRKERRAREATELRLRADERREACTEVKLALRRKRYGFTCNDGGSPYYHMYLGEQTKMKEATKFATGYEWDIMARVEQASGGDKPGKAGVLRAILLDLDGAKDAGVPSSSVMFTREGTADLAGMEWKLSAFLGDQAPAASSGKVRRGGVFLLDLMIIEERYRGFGVALLAARDAMKKYQERVGMFLILPFPVQCGPEEHLAALPMHWPSVGFEECYGADQEWVGKWSGLLRRYYQILGFKRIEGTRYMARSAHLKLPTDKELFQALRAWRQRSDRGQSA